MCTNYIYYYVLVSEVNVTFLTQLRQLNSNHSFQPLARGPHVITIFMEQMSTTLRSASPRLCALLHSPTRRHFVPPLFGMVGRLWEMDSFHQLTKL